MGYFPTRNKITKRAYISLFIFSFCPVFVYSACPTPANLAGPFAVLHINDGDTIKLNNGEHLRFIGIDTPEMRYDNPQLRQPFAEQARKKVREIFHQSPVWIAADRDQIDPYQRRLAYPFNDKYQNVTELLLELGLGRFWVIGNNDKFWQCLRAAEQRAREHQRGIWALAENQPISAAQIIGKSRAIQDFYGTITAIESSKRNIWLVIDDNLHVSFKSDDYYQFLAKGNTNLLGNSVLITGKAYFYFNKWRLNGTHPWQLTFINDAYVAKLSR